MERANLQGSFQISSDTTTDKISSTKYVSIETEIPEALYNGMKEFISDNPHTDQYGVMSSAIANFLYQNGCSDRAISEKYLDDLFNLPCSV
tara:strand:+ start:660 stop:932 length:273 start_codon:yes stop_codon:yes gene_type:complete